MEEEIVEQAGGQPGSERMLSQEHVNTLVTARVLEATEKERRKAEAHYAAELEKLKGQGQASQQSMGG